MFYVDTSIIVSAVTIEPANEAAADWLAAQPIASLWTSEWVETEVASALALKVRQRVLSAQERQFSWQQWLKLRTRTLTTAAIEARHFRMASDLLNSAAVPLRAGDALHLAIAMDHRLGIATRDREFATAGEMADVIVVRL